VPAGWLADRFGGKLLYGGGILLSSVVSLLTPAAARIHIRVLMALNFLAGLGEGTMRPSNHAMIARWSAPQQRSLVATAIIIGSSAGVTSGTFLAGVLCDFFGWPFVFFVFGMVGSVWSISWFLLCYDSPNNHPRITAAERQYWETNIGTADSQVKPPTPWREILTSVPVWALAVAFFADTWGFFTLMTCLPMYMHDVLGVDTAKNGLFSALPFATALIVGLLSGWFCDWLRARLSTTVVRKLICIVSFTVIACFLIIAGYIGCNRALAVAVMCTIASSSAAGFSVVGVNQLDLAPLHAGKIMGLTYTVANFGSIAAPTAVGALTYKHSSRTEWRHVFFLVAAIYVVGMIVFVIFGSGERQSWANNDASHDEPDDALDRKNNEQ